MSLDSSSSNPFLPSSDRVESTSEHTLSQVDEWASAQVPVDGFRSRTLSVTKVLEGDHIRVTWERREKKSYLKSFEILEAAADRIKAPCPHFALCGGCQWQHLSSEKLLKRKVHFVHETLKRAIEPTTILHDPLLSPALWHYRNKMEYSFGKSKGAHTLGLHRTRHDVIDLNTCPIAPRWFEKALEHVRAWWKKNDRLLPFHHASETGHLRHLMLREAIQGSGRIAVLTVSGNPDYALTREEIEGFKAAILESVEQEEERAKTVIFLTLQQCLPSQPTRFFEMHLHGPDIMIEKLVIDTATAEGTFKPQAFEFSISPSTFFQPNTKGAQALINQAMKMLGSEPIDCLWDLFCGSGTLSIIASRFAKRVLGVEINPMAVLDAEVNSRRNGCENVEFICSDLHKSPQASVDKLLEKGGQKPDVMIIDPPRAGIMEAGAKLLGAIGARRLLYISCNPLSQARDLDFLKQHGYRLAELCVVDQFPQTGHIETIGLLIR